jgi:2-methylfumaryl-CoA hydratase
MVWRKAVRVGDEISTTAQIIGLKENSSLKTGIVYVRTIGANQDGETVLEYCRWVMVKKSRREATPFLGEPAIPKLAASVAADQLLERPSEPFSVDATGGTFFFEDYEVGERIFHVDGTTINSSDHMSFTRLYQNTARVHFDSIATDGNPLVYGGLPLSLGYAQAFNGIENRLGIAAINGGTHANPVHAGDTLYSFTEVLDRAELSKHHGALRLRLIVVKNQQPSDDSFAIKVRDKQTGREVYNGSVVLDLDYWELVASRGNS